MDFQPRNFDMDLFLAVAVLDLGGNSDLGAENSLKIIKNRAGAVAMRRRGEGSRANLDSFGAH